MAADSCCCRHATLLSQSFTAADAADAVFSGTITVSPSAAAPPSCRCHERSPHSFQADCFRR